MMITIGAHPDGHQHGVSVEISINLGKKYLRISRIRKILVTCDLNSGLYLLNGFDFKVHLTPKIFSLKRIYLLFEIILRKKVLDSVKSSIFCVPTKSRKLHQNTAILFHDRVLGEWVQRLL